MSPTRCHLRAAIRGATMLSFGLGAGLPLAALGLLSREAVLRIAVLVVTGLDKRIETLVVDHFPQWLTDLTTRF